MLAAITGPLGYIMAFLFAWFINELPRYIRAFAVVVFYAPTISGQAYLVWSILFSGDAYGYVNSFLIKFGFISEPILWLTDTAYMMNVIIIVVLWMSLGQGFLSFVAGLQGIDNSQFEAGYVDGVKNRWQELWYITLPGMKPMLLFGAVMAITQTFGVADQTMALCGFPSTDYAARTVVTHLIDYGTTRFEMGYASAIATILFAVMLLLNKAIQSLLSKVGILFGIFFVLPLVYSISSAFKPLDEIYLYPPRFFVKNPTFNNFQDLLVVMSSSYVPFTRYVFNTVFITLFGTVGHLIIGSMAAYVLAKYEFPGSRKIFKIIQAAIMFNAYVLQIPTYIIMSKLGWIDTYLALMVPAFALPMGLFLMKQFMEQIPDALIEAAKIDGAKEGRIFLQIPSSVAIYLPGKEP